VKGGFSFFADNILTPGIALFGIRAELGMPNAYVIHLWFGSIVRERALGLAFPSSFAESTMKVAQDDSGLHE